MRPIMQTKLSKRDGSENGNCLAACVASILECPIKDVPSIENMTVGGMWRKVLKQWLEERGYSIHQRKPENYPKGRHYISVGKTKFDIVHAVVSLDGLNIHCPTKGQENTLENVMYIITIDKL